MGTTPSASKKPTDSSAQFAPHHRHQGRIGSMGTMETMSTIGSISTIGTICTIGTAPHHRLTQFNLKLHWP
jgi:hypothetical protein